MDLVHPEIDRYLDDLSRSADPILAEMERVATQRGFPIVGPQVGRLLFVMARSAGARTVLELGSGFGYSAHWFARAVGPQGQVVLTEGSAERATEARDFLERAGLAARVRIEVGNALEIAAGLDGFFDVVFNDIDKHDYPRVVPLAIERVRPGGLLISDNMLWQGNVVGAGPHEPSTLGVLGLTRALYESDEFFPAIVPSRDGVIVAVRRDA